MRDFMRLLWVVVLFFGLAAGLPAVAQGVAVPGAPAAVVVPKAVPGKPGAGAIIPGSPLAARAAAAATAPPGDVDADAPAPFGTDAIGFSLTSAVGSEALRTFGDFVSAVQRSTQLTPVWTWLRSFSSVPVRRAHLMDIVWALGVSVVPGLVVEAVLRFALAWPRAAVIRRATPPEKQPVLLEDEANGLEDAEAGETERLPRRHLSLRVWGRRFGFGVVHLLLSVLPLVGFALTLQVFISAGVLTVRPAHLAVIGIANAYLFSRLVLEVLQFLFSPDAAALRVVSMPTRWAAWLLGLAQVLLITGVFGYVLISVGEVLGLTQDGADVLARLVSLGIHIEVAIAVWQSRRVVGGWIAGDLQAHGVFAGFRHRLGGGWHYLALFYVFALWVAWAGGVHNAFVVLLRVVAVFVAALLIGRLGWVGSALLLEKAFPDPAGAAVRYPTLYARAHAYNPMIRALLRGVIGVLVVVLVLQGWGVDVTDWLLTNAFSRSLIGALIAIVITIAIALVCWEGANILLEGRIERLTQGGRLRQASRLRTLLPMFRASIGVSISLVAGLICLSKIGVNAAPLLAGAGVLGIAIGFGSQKLVQDIITGLFLLLEDAMQVGDVVSLAGMNGTVERLSIRTIRLRWPDGSVNIIPFSAVTTVTNMTRDFGYAQISINVGYKEDIDRVSAVLTDIAQTMRAEAAWGAMMRGDLQLFGLDAFTQNALVITGQIRTGPGQHWAVRREFYRRVLQRFAEEGIEIPYNNQVFMIEPAPPQ
jgi:small conductance mechanosensitive channel